MQTEFNIQEYMTKGVERVVADALKATFSNPTESAFMLKFAAASKKASQKKGSSRKKWRAHSSFFDCQHNFFL